MLSKCVPNQLSLRASNTAQIGNEYYKQMVGIPQGSVLSTMLCSFFYGDLERSTLAFTRDDDCVCLPPSSVYPFWKLSKLLFRYVDDYCFVTSNLMKAKGFLAIMNNGLSESFHRLNDFRTVQAILNMGASLLVTRPWSISNFAVIYIAAYRITNEVQIGIACPFTRINQVSRLPVVRSANRHE